MDKEKKQLSIYRSKILNEQISYLEEKTGENSSQIVRRAIDRMCREEKEKDKEDE